MSSPKNINLATYMCPSVPVEYFQTLVTYLQQELNTRVTLIYDSINTGPTNSDDDSQNIDIAFVSTTSFLDTYNTKDSKFKLLEAGATSTHPKKGQVLGYYTDVVLYKDFRGRVKEMDDLRGTSLAFAGESSISSAKQLLLNLKQMGDRSSFFSTTKNAESHMDAIEMVIGKKADVATVSSISLNCFLKHHYYLASEIFTYDTWGALPPHPIIVRKSIPDDFYNKILNTFLNLHKIEGFLKKMEKFAMQEFRPTTLDTYASAWDILEKTRKLSICETYY